MIERSDLECVDILSPLEIFAKTENLYQVYLLKLPGHLQPRCTPAQD